MWFLCVWLDQPCAWQRSSLSVTLAHTVYGCYIRVKYVRRIELLASLACYESCEIYFYEVFVLFYRVAVPLCMDGWRFATDCRMVWQSKPSSSLLHNQQQSESCLKQWQVYTPTANNMAVCSSGRVNGPLRCLYFVTRTKSPVLVLYTKPLVRV